jgi:hypothetical protein
MRLSLLIALGVGLLRLVLAQLIPQIIAPLSVFLAIAISIAIGVILIVLNPKGFEGKELLKLIVGISSLVIALFLLFCLIQFRKSIKIMGLYLAWSTEFV